jgi:hypothetical protein
MAVKYHIMTSQVDMVEKRLKFIAQEFLNAKVGAVTWERRGNEFWILINYLTENVVYDRIVSAKFKGRLKKIDKGMVIRRL